MGRTIQVKRFFMQASIVVLAPVPTHSTTVPGQELWCKDCGKMIVPGVNVSNTQLKNFLKGFVTFVRCKDCTQLVSGTLGLTSSLILTSSASSTSTSSSTSSTSSGSSLTPLHSSNCVTAKIRGQVFSVSRATFKWIGTGDNSVDIVFGTDFLWLNNITIFPNGQIKLGEPYIGPEIRELRHTLYQLFQLPNEVIARIASYLKRINKQRQLASQ